MTKTIRKVGDDIKRVDGIGRTAFYRTGQVWAFCFCLFRDRITSSRLSRPPQPHQHGHNCPSFIPYDTKPRRGLIEHSLITHTVISSWQGNRNWALGAYGEFRGRLYFYSRNGKGTAVIILAPTLRSWEESGVNISSRIPAE